MWCFSLTISRKRLFPWICSTEVLEESCLLTCSSYSKSLSKALPDRVFRQISLGDIKPDVAKKFVISHLDIEKGDPSDALTQVQKQDDLEELDEAITGNCSISI